MRVLDAVVRLSSVLQPRQQLGLEDLLQVYQGRPRQVGLIRDNREQWHIPTENKQNTCMCARRSRGTDQDEERTWKKVCVYFLVSTMTSSRQSPLVKMNKQKSSADFHLDEKPPPLQEAGYHEQSHQQNSLRLTQTYLLRSFPKYSVTISSFSGTTCAREKQGQRNRSGKRVCFRNERKMSHSAGGDRRLSPCIALSRFTFTICIQDLRRQNNN